jgi:hypothetical protein
MDCWAIQGIVSSLPTAVSLRAGLLAYIDPGTGSLVFQMLVAGLLTAGLMLRTVRSRVFGFLGGPLFGRGRSDSSRTADPAMGDGCRISNQPQVGEIESPSRNSKAA